MDLTLTDEQEMIRDGAARLLAKLSGPEQVRAAEATGFDPDLWDALVAMGIPAMTLPEEVGGGGSTLADLGVAVEECGAALATVPVVEVAVAGRALASLGGTERAAEVASGTVVTTSPRPAVDGRATLVPGAGSATQVLVRRGDELVLASGGGDVVRTLAGLGAADVALDDAEVLASGDAARVAAERAADEWRALTAAWLVGLAQRALDIGIAYATERHQFGVPIGSFQSLQHRLADLATEVEGARLVARKALWALDGAEPEAAAYPAMAFALASDVAQRTASASLHVHGGYGFMEEYDIQLHFRRAKAARLLAGDPRDGLLEVADRCFGPVGAPLARDESVVLGPVAPSRRPDRARRDGLEFRLPEPVEAFRAEARDFLSRHVTDEVIETAHRTGTVHDWGLHRAMAAEGWISAGWPAEWGGQGRSSLEMNALTEEMYLSGAPVDGLGVATLVAHTLLHEGTDWQKGEIIPKVLSGEVMICLGYSEPDAGSDVAACATKAVRDGDEWVVNGQKMFTTLAHESQYVFLLARTNTEVAKHKGLTMFVVPMDQAGISVTPVHTMGGERTNITWYDDVRVPDRYRVGEVDGGWKVMMTALVFERNSAWYGEAVRLLDHGLTWARESGRIDEPSVRERLARAAIGNEVANLLGWKAAWLASSGGLPGVEGTMAKLFTTEHYQRSADDLLDVLGAEGLRRHGEEGAPADGWIEATFRHCQVTTIYGGTSEVCRGVIAERGLGLPRGRA
ncbi:acyl-CoA dehydrogenase [Iamia majanohamensis]|uniref:Acyl-CoA dehydrogenase n=1 Tax=Iamia majanohamensis TaxID=467976 RepID=A0AAE9Y410_9ACTN|nr:acyl-CoA dehydrogenase [Iamia majanohamensis]WCO66170.1 acyl-CoA dehydrogenase [Iamia majanohamensis]